MSKIFFIFRAESTVTAGLPSDLPPVFNIFSPLKDKLNQLWKSTAERRAAPVHGERFRLKYFNMTLQQARVRRGKRSHREGNENEAEAAVGVRRYVGVLVRVCVCVHQGYLANLTVLWLIIANRKGKAQREEEQTESVRYKDRGNLDGLLGP